MPTENLGGRSCLEDRQRLLPMLRGRSDFPQRQCRKRRVRIHQYRDGSLARNKVLQDLQPFGGDIVRLIGQTCDIGTGLAKACNQTGANGVADRRKNDGDRLACGRSRLCRKRSEPGNQHVRIGQRQFGGKIGQTFRPPFGRTVCQHQVPALAVAQLPEPLRKRLRQRRVLTGKQREVIQPVGYLRRLGIPSKRPGRGRAARKTDEFPPPHSAPGPGQGIVPR